MKVLNRKTKIICTIGPASDSEERLMEMIEAGMNVARLNFSHGSHSYFADIIKRIRRASDAAGVAVSIMQDLQGPKIRIGTFGNGRSIELRKGDRFTITTDPVAGDQSRVSTEYNGLINDVRPGDLLLLNDGMLELRVDETTPTEVITTVVIGGTLSERKGINLPNSRFNVPTLTQKDRDDLAFGLANGVDYVAVSFIQRARDLRTVRNLMRALNPDRADTPIIAKLEKPAALKNLDSILDECQGVMVARGDLGVELSPQKVPSAQKLIIEKANEHGNIVITATQMLESMVTNPHPTRAEASDIANAIFDGTDALMLSAETASGGYPVSAVNMMASIADEAEQHEHEWGRFKELYDPTSINAVAIARAARALANNLSVAAIAVFTRSGSTARIVSKERPRVPILAFTPNPETYSRMALLWGVTPYLVPRAMSVEEMLLDVEQAMMHAAHLQLGQQVVLISGLPIAQMGQANMVLLHTVGQAL